MLTIYAMTVTELIEKYDDQAEPLDPFRFMNLCLKSSDAGSQNLQIRISGSGLL
jgi:hypothetical protein